MSPRLLVTITKALAIAITFLSGSASAALIFNDEALFNSQLSTTIFDDYKNPPYVFVQDNISMSAVLGETDYMSTGHDNHNIVTNDYYCAGCNGSFQLGFMTTSVGSSSGVFGVGFNTLFNTGNLTYDAFITLGDNSTLSVDLGTGSGFFGITSASLIKSIDFGLGDGSQTTFSGNFALADLTIGSAANIIPEPSSVALLVFGIMGLLVGRRKRLR